jgi:hypothetical protein
MKPCSGLFGDAAAGRAERRDGQLGVPDVLPCHVTGDLERQQPDVLRGTDQVHHREIDLDEVPEIGEGEEVGQRLRVRGHYGVGVAGGQLGDDAG